MYRDINLLTARQREVLTLVAKGKRDREIAEALVIALRTVGNHLHAIYNKLGVHNRTAATRLALENGLLEDRKIERAAHDKSG